MSGFGERLNQRQKGFKKAADADEARRKREDAAIQLRKQTREEALQKKRMTDDVPGGVGPQPFSTNGGSSMEEGEGPSPEVLEALPGMVQALNSDSFDAVFNATQQFRKMLSVDKNPPIVEVINAGIVPRVVQLLREVGQPRLQFEAAWVLTNIASGTADQTRIVVEHGALPLFVELLQSPDEDVREQAVWALGNIAGDCANFRDLVLQSGGLAPIMKLVVETNKVSLMRNATWTLSNLCRAKPPPPLEWVAPALSTFATLLNCTDVEVLTDACWALSYLSDGTNDRIAAVIQSGVCSRLVELLCHESHLVQTPALRTSGNIVTGDDEQTQVMVQSGLLAVMPALLAHSKKSIRREACWTISNITAGNVNQIQQVINHQLIPPIIEALRREDFDIKKEASWAISNATVGGSAEQIAYLLEKGCMKPMCDLLTCSDTKIVAVALDAIDRMLRTGQEKQLENGLADNPVVRLVEEAGGLVSIEALQEDPSEEVYQKSVKMLETYFPIEDDDAPVGEVTADGTGFAFGAVVPEGGFNFGG
mmetsp:Transcript_126876/g.364927  ORF Transcript_126876/g.364927 Transcript_126876/m.364927 type:complete len:537 (+) Transcript_126876:117-1727(+)